MYVLVSCTCVRARAHAYIKAAGACSWVFQNDKPCNHNVLELIEAVPEAVLHAVPDPVPIA